jgi:hypothetical protein
VRGIYLTNHQCKRSGEEEEEEKGIRAIKFEQTKRHT